VLVLANWESIWLERRWMDTSVDWQWASICWNWALSRLEEVLSELVQLKELEEVLDFEAPVLGHVCAVDSVSDSIVAELSPTHPRVVSVTTKARTYLIVLGRKCLAISGSW